MEGKRDTPCTSMRIRCVRLRMHAAPVFLSETGVGAEP